MPMRNVVLDRETVERVREVLVTLMTCPMGEPCGNCQGEGESAIAALDAALSQPEPTWERTNDEFSRIHIPALRHRQSFTIYRSHPKRTDIRQEICLRQNSYGHSISSLYIFDVEALALALALLELATEPTP